MRRPIVRRQAEAKEGAGGLRLDGWLGKVNRTAGTGLSSLASSRTFGQLLMLRGARRTLRWM